MSELIGKTKNEVRTELGDPVTVDHWDVGKPPDDLHGAALEAWKGAELDSIWVYRDRVVHFSLTDDVIKETDDSWRWINPNPPAVS